MKNVLVKFGSIKKRQLSTDEAAGTLTSGDSGICQQAGVVEQQLARLKAAEQARKVREERLSGLQPFCIDATLVECLSTGYETAEDKVNIFKLLTSCGLTNITLAAFVKDTSPDIKFLQALRSQNLIDEHCFAFSELFDANGSDLPGQDLPYGLAKMIQFGIQNAILECDVAAPYINWDKYTTEDFCALVESRCRWVAANLYAGRSTPPASYVHLRDFAAAMQVAPGRVLQLVEYLGRLEPGVRPAGLLVHEPGDGGHFPFEAAPCVAAVRAVMDATGWTEQPVPQGGQGQGGGGGGGGVLSIHVTAGDGLAHATVLECLAAGCGGVMASTCEEAEPSSRHVFSLLDLVNLTRLGNPHVAERFELRQLRGAAGRVAEVVRRAAAEAVRQRALAEQRAAEAARAREEEEEELAGAQPPTRPTSAATSSAPQRQPLILGHA